MSGAGADAIDSQAIRRLELGSRITWFGQRVQIGRMIRNRIELLSPDGTVLGAPFASEVYAAAQQPGSGPQLWMDQDPLELLKGDDAALADYREKLEIIHRLFTGRRSDDAADAEMLPGLDPGKFDLEHRRKQLAEYMSREPRTSGPLKGSYVSLDAARKHIDRVLKRWRSYGPMGLVHQNRLRSRDPSENAVRTLMYAFLDKDARGSTRTNMAQARRFKAHIQKHHADVALPQNKQLAQYVTDWHAGQDHSGGTSKTRISASNRPDMAPVVRLVTRAGELVLFDTTKVNVWVRNPDGGKYVRLELTIAMDLFTRAIVGMSLTHTTPSVAIALCLADVIVPRAAEALEEWDGDSPTPYAGCFDEIDFLARVQNPDTRGFLPEAVHTDNGIVYVSTTLVAVCAYLGISAEQSRAYTPTDKAQIEGWFGDFKKQLEQLLPGFLGGSHSERGADTEAEAALTAVEYELAVRRFIYAYNRRIMDDLHTPDDPFVPVSPMEKWEWSINMHGQPRTPNFELDPVRLLPWVDLKPDAGRVWCKRLWYRSPILARLASDQLVSNADGELRIYYDPTDMRQVFTFDENGKCERIPWRDLSPYTPRFGLYFIGAVHDWAQSERYSTDQFEALLVEIASRYSFKEPLSPEEVKALSTPEQYLANALKPLFRRVKERFRIPPMESGSTDRVPSRTRKTATNELSSVDRNGKAPFVLGAVEALPAWEE